MIKNRWTAFVLFVILFTAFWNVLDFLYTRFIAGGSYGFSAAGDMLAPVAVGVVAGYLLFLNNEKKD